MINKTFRIDDYHWEEIKKQSLWGGAQLLTKDWFIS